MILALNPEDLAVVQRYQGERNRVRAWASQVTHGVESTTLESRAGIVTSAAREARVVSAEVLSQYASSTRDPKYLAHYAGMEAAHNERAQQHGVGYVMRVAKETPEQTRERVYESLRELQRQQQDASGIALVQQAVAQGTMSPALAKTAQTTLRDTPATVEHLAQVAELAAAENRLIHERLAARSKTLQVAPSLGQGLER